MTFQQPEFANIKWCLLLHMRHPLPQQNKGALYEYCFPLRSYKSDALRHLDTHKNS